MKKILIISASPRKNSNSGRLAGACARGAGEAGHTGEKICLHDKALTFCKGGLSCQKTQRCVMHDDADVIVRKMKGMNSIAFVSPVCYYEMCGQMKTLLDRSNPLFFSEYSFRDIYLPAAAAEDAQSALNGALNGLKGWIACFEKSRLKGVARDTGVTMPGEMRHKAAALEAAYALGKNA